MIRLTDHAYVSHFDTTRNRWKIRWAPDGFADFRDHFCVAFADGHTPDDEDRAYVLFDGDAVLGVYRWHNSIDPIRDFPLLSRADFAGQEAT